MHTVLNAGRQIPTGSSTGGNPKPRLRQQQENEHAVRQPLNPLVPYTHR